MSRQRKGKVFESDCSKFIHQEGIALLVDPTFLRRRGLGQVDLARVVSRQIHIFEIKSAPVGYLMGAQRARLRMSADYLAQLLQCEVRCQLYSKQLSVAF